MNLLGYIKKYGDLTFKEKKINEIDILIMSMITYIDFGSVRDFYLKDEGNEIIQKITKKQIRRKLHGIKSAYVLLPHLVNSKRFKNLYIHDYVYEYNSYMQFKAMIFDINDYVSVIAFEGTDDLVSGWYEDARVSFEYPVPAQKRAIKYVKNHVKYFSKRKYILCGHSKGGNLALVSAMNAKKHAKDKIKKIYSFDGLGLKNDDFKTKKYLTIKNKYELIVPDFCIIGLILYHPELYRVISATKKNPYSHDPIYWELSECEFVPAKLVNFSKNLDLNFKKALDDYNDYEKKEMIDELFSIFDKAEIKSLDDFMNFNLRKIYKFISESKKMDITMKNFIKSLLKYTAEK